MISISTVNEMEYYFVDTSAFYAYKDPSDQHHAQAISFMEGVRQNPNVRLITSNFIIDETLTLVRMKLGHKPAVQLGEQIRSSRIIEVIQANKAIEEQAWQIFVKYGDKDYSFTDCVSFAIMDARALTKAFTFDKHFAQHGLPMYP
ncbi:MAG: type II toxin-antitoxin system VapC family toxin [Dehalococcoidia bacterium]